MKALLITGLMFLGGLTSFSQTAHDNFMSSKIKTNSAGDFNNWVQGDNDFSTVTQDDWNSWTFSFMGLEGTIETQTQGDYTSWQVANTDITMVNADGDFNDWEILGESHTLGMNTTNWNTWVLTGALVSGISTTVTDDFNEFEIQGGDWTQSSPYFRAATVFISVMSSSVLRFI